MEKIGSKQRRHALKTAIIAPVLMAAVILTAILSCSSMQEGKTLFESKCAKCHPLEYAFREKKSLAEWNKTTETMARYSEGSITEKEAQIIAKYLANI